MDGIRVAHVTTVDLTLRFLLLAQLRRLRDEGYDVVAISAPGPWVGDLRTEGIRHIAWRHATRAWDPFADALALAELVRIFRRERFDLVHTHNPKPGILGRIGARLAGVPFVVNTVHGFYATPDDPLSKRLPVMALEWLAARFSDLELYQSAEDLGWARRWRFTSRANSVLLGNGTDLARFDPVTTSDKQIAQARGTLGVREGELVVGTVGRMVREKGYREFFAAARRVRQMLPHVRFVAVGGRDPDKRDAIRQEELAGARDDVVFVEWRTDIPLLLASMDIFVLASWREGLPRSAIEAAAMGKAMVLTDIRGCREVARHGVEGILVPPRDAERLSQAILALARDPELRRRLGKAARSRALERFDELQVTDNVVARYRDLLTPEALGNGRGAFLRRAGSERA